MVAYTSVLRLSASTLEYLVAKHRYVPSPLHDLLVRHKNSDGPPPLHALSIVIFQFSLLSYLCGSTQQPPLKCQVLTDLWCFCWITAPFGAGNDRTLAWTFSVSFVCSMGLFNTLECVQKIIRYDQVIGIYKRNTAKVFPNAIEIVTQQHKYFFCSFMFRDAAFRLAASAWQDYLESGPMHTTHRINVNSKLDLELFVKKDGGDELVRMIEDATDDDDSTSDLGGLSGPTRSKSSGLSEPSRGGSTTSIGNGASASMSTLPAFHDSSEEGDTDKSHSKRRKSVRSSKKDSVTGKREPLDVTDEDDGRKSVDGTFGSPPNASRGSMNLVISSSPPQLRAKAVGFDLSHPADGLPNSDANSGDAVLGGSAPISPTGNTTKAAPSSSSAAAPSAVSSSAPQAASSSSGAPLPDIGASIPMNSSCQHTVEEANDKKFEGKKLGNKVVFKNVTIAQYFALAWANPDYNEDLIAHFSYTEWSCPAWKVSDNGCCITRFVTYRMPLNIPMGPKSTRQEATQNARYKDANTLYIETCNISKDVPFGDGFEVREKWVVVQVGNDVHLEASGAVIWKKAAWGLKGAISSRSIDGLIDNYAFVTKLMEQIISKWQSSGGAASAPSTDSSGASIDDAKRSSKKKTSPDEDDSDDSDETKKRGLKSTRKNGIRKQGTREVGMDIRDSGGPSSNVSSAAAAPARPSIAIGDWKMLVFLLLVILGVAALASVFFSLSSMTSRLHHLELSRAGAHHSSYEEKNLRERVAFLEHLTTALLRNVSDPGSYKSEQQKYWGAIKDLEDWLGKTSENIMTLKGTVHTSILTQEEQAHEPLTADHVVDALKTLPVDRKVLSYLMHPENFAKQLAQTLSPQTGSASPSSSPEPVASQSPVSASDTSSTFYLWPLYFGLILCVLAAIIFAVAKFFGFGSS